MKELFSLDNLFIIFVAISAIFAGLNFFMFFLKGQLEELEEDVAEKLALQKEKFKSHPKEVQKIDETQDLINDLIKGLRKECLSDTKSMGYLMNVLIASTIGLSIDWIGRILSISSHFLYFYPLDGATYHATLIGLVVINVLAAAVCIVNLFKLTDNRKSFRKVQRARKKLYMIVESLDSKEKEKIMFKKLLEIRDD